MLRALSLEEVAFVSGGMMDTDDGFDGDGGGGGDDGGFADGGDYGGGSDDPGQVAGPPDTTDSPKYDSSTDPNSYNYGHDSSNPYESGSNNQGSPAPVNSGTSALNNQPSYVTPPIGIPSSDNTNYANLGNGTSAGVGGYGSFPNYTGGKGNVKQQF